MIGVPLWNCVCVPVPHFWSLSLFRICVRISTCTHGHLTPKVCSTPLNSYMEHGWACVALCVFQHPTLGPILCLECVHTSVYVYISSWLSMSAPTHLSILKETWVLLFGTMCAKVTPHLVHTLVRMFTCISICVYVHLTPNVCFSPFASSHGNVWHSVCIPVILILVQHLG